MSFVLLSEVLDCFYTVYMIEFFLSLQFVLRLAWEAEWLGLGLGWVLLLLLTLLWLFCVLLRTGSHYIAHASLKLPILLPSVGTTGD